MQFRILVDTIERHTRRYIIEAVDAEEAGSIVYGASMLDYEDSFESLEGGDNDFSIVEVEPLD